MSSNFLSLGGLAQILTPPLGAKTASKTGFAFSCLASQTHDDPHSIFIADEGFPYPAALSQAFNIPLSRLLIVKTEQSEDVWKIGLEAIQTGLFGWSFLRPSRACHTNHLRKLQLSAERTQSRVFILSDLKLPHWMFRAQFHAEAPHGENSLSARHQSALQFGGSVSGAYAQSVAP